MPAAPPPTITTSVAPLATRYSAPIWIETCASIERPIVPLQRCPVMRFQCRYCRHAPRDSNGFLRPQSQRPLARSPLQGANLWLVSEFLGVRVAVEFGVQAANCFDLGG
jgi:hypothetical protein